MLGRTIRRIEAILHEIESNTINRWYNSEFDKHIGSHVRRHIKILQEGQHMSPIERDADRLYSILRKDYEDHYCPPSFFPGWLNGDNRLKYFMLRLEIDEALDDSNYLFA